MSIDDKTAKLESGIENLGSEVLEKGKKFASKLPVVGHVAWLYSQLDSHKYFSMQDLEHRVIPPISLDQCKLYLQGKAGGLPAGFVSWAYLSDEAQEKYLHTRKIAPHDWKSGDNVWLIDVVAPWGGQDGIFKELKDELLAGKDVNLLMPSGSNKFNSTTIQELLEIKSRKGH